MSAPARASRTLVLVGGGGFSDGSEELLLERWLLGLCRGPAPRVAFVPTASGDSDLYVDKFARAFGSLPCRPSVLRLFQRDASDLDALVSNQDLLFVGGGNTANLLAVWRVHGLDAILERAYRGGTILSGVSAGALCWLEGGVTDSFGPLAVLQDGLRLLPGVTTCPHYDLPERCRVFQSAVQNRELAAGYGIDDGVALRFVDGALVECVAERAGAGAYRIEPGAREASREALAVRVLEAKSSARASRTQAKLPSVEPAEPAPAPSKSNPGAAARSTRADQAAKRRIVYTDGACSGNPGPGGWAWAVVDGPFAAGAEAHTTNQRMEIGAVLEALRALDGPLEIVSDSKYVVNCFEHGWYKTWLRNGWRTSQKQPVKNQDLWEPLIDLVRRRGVTFRWVKGHGGDAMNELVDRLAVEAAERQRGRRGDATELGPRRRATR